ncbi:MAG: Lrp/AsnC family transcriptional regulator [Candidatus Omnitrophota bacterium]|nr:Lrp/AsnC family transcriptional regulator [Candidatus Omnitrophota bacterium]
MLSKFDKSIISLISQDIPLVKEPFKRLSLKLGIKQDVLLKRLAYYKKINLLRKFCASLNHRKIGFEHNAMVVWNIPDACIIKVGKLMAAFSQVSHCYQRKKASDWNYNLYSMIHGRSKKECLDVVEGISKRVGYKDYKILFSSEEYKKIAARY